MSTVDADVTVRGGPEGGPEPELTVARVARVGDLELRRLELSRRPIHLVFP